MSERVDPALRMWRVTFTSGEGLVNHYRLAHDEEQAIQGAKEDFQELFGYWPMLTESQEIGGSDE